jgi:transcriptional regulator with XRE-family HTH domain
MIGKEVRRHRQELGLTGAQLAARAGMAPSAVSQIETGKRTPSSTSVMKLAEALGVEVAELFPKSQAPLPLDTPDE